MTTNCFLRSFLNIVIFINLSIAWTPHQMIFKLPNIISNIRKSSLKLNMIPRRMPAPKTRNNDIIKKLLIDLIDMENVELAPNLLAPHIEVIMKSNITHACFDLIKDLNLNNESEGYDYVMAASDYITCFINEFEFQKSSITNQHRDILNSIIQVSKNGTIEEINKVISINSPHYTSSFLTNLRNEIKYLDESSNNVENAALSSLLRTIQCRILNELETLTTADVQVFRAILDTKRKSFSDDIELLTDVVLTTLERRDEYGKRRFIAFVHALKEETLTSQQTNTTNRKNITKNDINNFNTTQIELQELIELLENEIFPKLSLPENIDSEDGVKDGEIADAHFDEKETFSD